MNPYLLLSAFLGISLLVETCLLVKSMLVSLYRYRNIQLSGFMLANILLLAYIVYFGIQSDPELVSTTELFAILRLAPRAFAHSALWIISVLGIAMFISNISLAKHEGARPHSFIGTVVGLLCVAGTLAAYLIAFKLDNLEVENASLVYVSRFLSLFVYCLLDYVECIMFGMIIMGLAAAKAKPVYDKDYIMILGCSIRKDGGLLPLLRGRTNKAIRYAWDQEIATGKKVCYVPSGGKGADEVMSEGSAMELYLLAHGAEPDEVFAEKMSRNTFENFKFSKVIVDELKDNARVAFSTTNYHVLRSGILAKRVGFKHVEGIASSTKWYFWPNGFMREVVAIFAMEKKWQFLCCIIIAAVCLVVAGL